MYEKQTNTNDILEKENVSAEHLARKKKKAQILSLVNAYIEIRQKATQGGDSVSGILQEVREILEHGAVEMKRQNFS